MRVDGFEIIENESRWWIPSRMRGVDNAGLLGDDGTWVDPRACGVDFDLILIDEATQGGSPRMRGRLDCFVRFVVVRRWIPAHAG